MPDKPIEGDINQIIASAVNARVAEPTLVSSRPTSGIPVEDALRLLRSIVLDGMQEDGEQQQLQRWMSQGFIFSPDLDLQDIATITRILAGEKWRA